MVIETQNDVLKKQLQDKFNLQAEVAGRIDDTLNQMRIVNPLAPEEDLRQAAITTVLTGLIFDIGIALGLNFGGGGDE